MENEWLFGRCREVQAEPDGYLDLWARDHYKSTIITFGLSLFEILRSHGEAPLVGRECTIGIFSHTRPVAKAFLNQIKRELENNNALISLFPDILYPDPRNDAPKWAEDEGLIVKRRTNPKEATVEAWGLVDAMPTGRHFSHLVYDDVVTDKSVTTEDMMAKTTAQWELSENLGSEGGVTRIIGTRYHFGDTYGVMIDRGVVKVRKYPATDDGTEDGEPVFMTPSRLREKRRVQGPYTFGCQMLLDPRADAVSGFRLDWMRHYDGINDGAGMNLYLLVDPANTKKKKSDWTAMFIVGLAEDNNYYVLDMVRDRLALPERGNMLFALHRKWRPVGVGYEEYGMQADIAYMGELMKQQNYRFNITPLGGSLAKNERIRRLMAPFSQGRFWFPYRFPYTDYEGVPRDMVRDFTHQEYLAFPVGTHDDMLDCLSRILDEELCAIFPMTPQARDRYEKRPKKRTTWMAR